MADDKLELLQLVSGWFEVNLYDVFWLRRKRSCLQRRGNLKIQTWCTDHHWQTNFGHNIGKKIQELAINGKVKRCSYFLAWECWERTIKSLLQIDGRVLIMYHTYGELSVSQRRADAKVIAQLDSEDLTWRRQHSLITIDVDMTEMLALRRSAGTVMKQLAKVASEPARWLLWRHWWSILTSIRPWQRMARPLSYTSYIYKPFQWQMVWIMKRRPDCL